MLMMWPRGGTPLIDGTPEDGTMLLLINGATASCPSYFVKDKPFYVYGVNDVEGHPYPLIPSMDADSDRDGRVQVSLTEALCLRRLSSKGWQGNVSALPVNNAMVVTAPPTPDLRLFPVRSLN